MTLKSLPTFPFLSWISDFNFSKEYMDICKVLRNKELRKSLSDNCQYCYLLGDLITMFLLPGRLEPTRRKSIKFSFPLPYSLEFSIPNLAFLSFRRRITKVPLTFQSTFLIYLLKSHPESFTKATKTLPAQKITEHEETPLKRESNRVAFTCFDNISLDRG